MSDAIGICVTDGAVHAYIFGRPTHVPAVTLTRSAGSQLPHDLERLAERLERDLLFEKRSIALALPTRMGHAERLACLEGISLLDPERLTTITIPSAGAIANLGSSSVVKRVVTFERWRGVLTASLLTSQGDSFAIAAVAHDPEGNQDPESAANDSSRFENWLDSLQKLRSTAIAALAPDERAKWNASVTSIWVGEQAVAPLGSSPGTAFTVWNAEEVSRGAARHAAAGSGAMPPIAILERLGRTIGLEFGDEDSFEVIFNSNELLPCSAALVFTTAEDHQPDCGLTLLEAPLFSRKHAEVVAEYLVGPLRSRPAGDVELEIGLSIDHEGIMSVAVRDTETDEFLHAEILDAVGTLFARQCGHCLESSPHEASFCEACGRAFPSTSADQAPSQDRDSREPKIMDDPMQVVALPPVVALGGTRDALANPSDEALLEETRPCPFCAEVIRTAAIKCRFCGEFLDERQQSLTATPPEGAHDAHAVDSPPPSLESAKQAVPTFEGQLFVSHASEDASIAESVVAACASRGVSTWLAQRDIRGGQNYASQIYNAIVSSSHILVLMSSSSVASPHDKREVNIAIDHGVVLLPLVVGEASDFMASLPSDWKYWLGVVQAITYETPDSAVDALGLLIADSQ